MQGVLGPSQRFDLLNVVSITSGTLSYLLPVAALALGFDLPAIVLSLAVARLATVATLFALCVRLYPSLRRVRFNFRLVRSLFGYGRWIAVSGLLIPILRSFEKLGLTTLVSVGALTGYVPCYTMISKVAIIPASLATSRFPAFSYYETKSSSSDLLRALSLNPIKYILLVMAPVTMTLVLFRGSILRIWLGVAFARQRTMLLGVLALGFFVHAFAYVPFAGVNDLGHSEWKAKLDLVQTPLFMALCWVLTSKIGLVGAALSKLAVCVTDFGCLFIMSKKLVGFSARDVASSALVKSFAVAIIPVMAGLLLIPSIVPLNLKFALFLALLFLYALATWWVAFDKQDRVVISASLQRFVPRKVV